MYSYGPPHMAKQKQDDRLEHTYSSYVRIRDVAQKTCQRRWMIGRSGERGSGISVLAARHDDGDDSKPYQHDSELLPNEFTIVAILSLRIWTRIARSVSCDDDYYTTNAYFGKTRSM